MPPGKPRVSEPASDETFTTFLCFERSTFGMNACAGLRPEQMTSWCRFEDIRHGGWDPAARLEEMAEDGVDAEVLYPTPRLNQAIIANPYV